MRIEFNRNGAERKALVKAIGETLNVKPKYMGMPSAAYEIDYFTVTKDGTLEFDDMADSEEIERVLEELNQRGFRCENAEYDEPQPEIDCEEPLEDCPPAYGTPETKPQGAAVGLTVTVPLDKVKVGNLTSLLDAKGSLIQKALGIPATPIEIGEEQISFPWFSELPDAETAKAYTHFISALCEMSVNQKRVTAKEKTVDNEKYAFRCFLLRLGFIGGEYKTERKILLQNLSGSSAFKSNEKKEAADDGISE